VKAGWVIEDFVADNCYKDLINEVKKQGHECCVISYEPFQSGNYDKVFADDDCVVFQGSINLAEQLQKDKPKWIPGVIANWRNYWCVTWYAHMREHLLNKDYRCMTVGTLLDEKWDLYRRFGQDATIWVRPDSGNKPFTAQTIELEKFDKFYDQWIKGFCKPEDGIVVSTPKKINSEFRYICSGNDIIAMSCYKYQENKVYVPSAPTKATEKCKEILTDLHHSFPINFPDAFFACDIWEDIEGNYYLGEFNAFSSCGLYKCNKEVIVRMVSEYAEQQYRLD
jgi:hypothetical protein